MGISQRRVTPTELDQTAADQDAAKVRRTSRLGEEMAGRIRRAQTHADLTVRALAERAHVSLPSVMRVRMGGGSHMDADLLADIARGLGVRPAWLVYGEGQPSKTLDPVEAIKNAIGVLKPAQRRRLFEELGLTKKD